MAVGVQAWLEQSNEQITWSRVSSWASSSPQRVARSRATRCCAGREFAQVVDVKPVMKTVRTPRQQCHDEQVVQQAPTRDPHQITGSVIGAVVGGVLGHQVGGGSGKKIATVAGAAAGGYAGNRVQKKHAGPNTVTTTQQRCETVYDSHQERIGYDVRYRLGKKKARCAWIATRANASPFATASSCSMTPAAEKT